MAQIIEHISPAEASEKIDQNRENPDFVILDVRTAGELEEGYIEGAKNMDMYSPIFLAELKKLDPQKTYLVYCRTGARSSHVLQIMQSLGFREAYNMTGGIMEWDSLGLPMVG